MPRSRALKWWAILIFFGISVYLDITSRNDENSKKENRAFNHGRDSAPVFLNVPLKVKHPKSKFELTRKNVDPIAGMKGWRERIRWERKVDPHLYSYLLNPRRKCVETTENGSTLRNFTLLVLVKSAPGNSKRRDAVRRTYMHGVVKHDVSCKVVFLLGVPNNDEARQRKIVEESMTYGDILQEDFVDSYYNLTTKLIMGFKWASTVCNNSHFVMSTDDDVMVDIVSLVNDLEKIPTKDRFNFALGQRTVGVGPIREPNSKWYTPVEMWPSNLYPVYPQGHGYIISKDVSHRAYKTSLEMPIAVPWDDVYFGILLEKLGSILVERKIWYRERHKIDGTKRSASIAPESDYVKIELSIKGMEKVWKEIDNVGRS